MAWPTILVQVAFVDPPLTAIGSNTWVDVTAYVKSFTTKRGRSDALNRVEAGTATVVLDNSDRRFDPTFAAGAYYPNVVPMKKIRISATYSAVTYRLFTGFIESWPPDWPGGLDVYTTISCVDAFKYFALKKLNGAYANEFCNWTIDTWLTNIGWPAGVGDRFLYPALSQIQSGTFVNVPALTHFQNAADVESGIFFIDPSGAPTLHDRHYRLTNSLTSLATFDDSAAATLPWLKLTDAYDDQQIWNEARITRTGGVEQVATDAASQAAYFTRTLTRTLPMLNDTEALNLAQWLVALYGLPIFRFTSMTLDGLMDDALWPWILSLAISQRITVTQHPPPLGTAITQECYIEGVAFDVAQDHWFATFGLSSAEAIVGSSYWILDDPVYSVLDSTTRLTY